MRKTNLLALVATTALVATPALAQTNTAPADLSRAPVVQPGTDAVGTPAVTDAGPDQQVGAQPTTHSMQPIAAPGPGQMLGSDLRGTRVYGANNESIGDISDVLVDRNGRMIAVIVGVGGFLGIGQKDVAVPFEALEIVGDRSATAMMGRAGIANDPATTGALGIGTGATGQAGIDRGNTQANTEQTAVGTVNPERIILRGMTKANLEAAPSFRTDGRSAAAQTGETGVTGAGTLGTGATGSGSGATNAPAQQ